MRVMIVASWKLPKDKTEHLLGRGHRQLHSGEPVWNELTKWPKLDSSLHTHEFQKCCGCGLEHTVHYVVTKGDDKWWLLSQAFMDPTSTLKARGVSVVKNAKRNRGSRKHRTAKKAVRRG